MTKLFVFCIAALCALTAPAQIAMRFNNDRTTNVAINAYSVYKTNLSVSLSPIVISGSTVSGVNGTYTLSSSNFVTGLPLVIWTNGLNNGKIMYANDPGVNIFGSSVVIETGSNDASFYYSTAILSNAIPAAPWTPNTAPGGDVLVETLTTNSAISNFQVVKTTNAVFVSSSTNLWVDPTNGDDRYASRTNRVMFSTIAGACAAATNGDIIELTTYVYRENSAITMPVGVTLNGHGSTISNAFTFTDNCNILDVRKFGSAPHFKMTNNVQAVFEFGVSTGLSGDGIDIDYGAGLMQFKNLDNGSWWDCCVLDRLASNSVVEFYSCRMASVFTTNLLGNTNLGGIGQGSHALTWYLDDTGGGKVRFYGGALTVLNATNTVFTGPFGNNNSCLSIVNRNGHTNIGNASLELYGPVIGHGTTNAGVTVTAITNTLNVPIYGYYIDSKLGNSLFDPSTTNTFVMLDPVSGNGSGWTNVNAANLTGTLQTAQFPATLPAASGVNLTALNGSQITSGTVPIARIASGTPDGTKFVRDDGTLVAVASAPTPSYFPSPSLPGSSYAKNRYVQMEYPTATGLGTFGMSPPSAITGTLTAFAPVAGLPLGLQAVPVGNAGGICGVNLTAPTVQWSTNSMNVSWDVSFITDVSSNRIFCTIGSLAPAGLDQPFRTFGFRRSHTFPDAGWVAYSNDSTVTNNIATGVSVALGTMYHLAIAKTNTSLTYYINGAQVATATWNPTPLAVRENWCDNLLNSQAGGMVFHNYYNDYTP